MCPQLLNVLLKHVFNCCQMTSCAEHKNITAVTIRSLSKAVYLMLTPEKYNNICLKAGFIDQQQQKIETWKEVTYPGQHKGSGCI